jgi:hypothetical protein
MCDNSEAGTPPKEVTSGDIKSQVPPLKTLDDNSLSTTTPVTNKILEQLSENGVTRIFVIKKGDQSSGVSNNQPIITSSVDQKLNIDQKPLIISSKLSTDKPLIIGKHEILKPLLSSSRIITNIPSLNSIGDKSLTTNKNKISINKVYQHYTSKNQKASPASQVKQIPAGSRRNIKIIPKPAAAVAASSVMEIESTSGNQLSGSEVSKFLF